MNIKSILECERKEMEKLKKFQLPYPFKRFGVIVAISAFLLLFVNRFFVELDFLRQVSRYGMLIGLLSISISRDEIEDEFIQSLRLQSSAFAFIFGVVMALIQPFANYMIDRLLEGEMARLEEVGDFQILWILLVIQVCYFELLKRVN